MAKKYMSLERLQEYDELIKGVIDEGDESVKSYVNTELAKKADSSHTHTIANVTNLQTTLDGKVPTTRTVNGKALSSNITLSASDVGADVSGSASAVQTNLDTHTNNSDIHVTTTNKSNWNSAYTHSTSAHAPSNAQANVIESIKVNGTAQTITSKAVNITVPTTAADVGAAASSHNHSASNITSGTLAIARGGTGGTTAAAARTNLEVYSTTEVDTALANKASSSHNHDSAYDAKGAADTALASAKTYADNVATTVKNDLLNGAGSAYDTLKELGDLIVDNADAIEALEIIASGKADATHSHAISDVSGLQSALDGKAASSHGTHVTFDSTNKPKMDGTAAFGTSTKVARADHVHPTDTSRASQADLEALEVVVDGKADSSHTHTVANITDLNSYYYTKTELDGAMQLINAGLSSLEGHVVRRDNPHEVTASQVGAYTKAETDALVSANKTTVDSALSSTSTNPVQNKVVNSAISTLTSTVSTNTSSISANTSAISALQTTVSEIQEITSAEIQALFA